MRRITAVVLLLLGVALATTDSHAQSTVPSTPSNIAGYCFIGPYNQLAPCPTSPTPTPAPILPEKNLSVGPAVGAPAGTTSYSLGITSRFLCFGLQEPVTVLTLGSPGVSALTEQFPIISGPADPLGVSVDPLTGTANLSLEVFNAEVGPEGLDVKAIWPQEGVEKVVNVIPPAAATPSPTAGAGTPTSTPTSVPPSPTATGPPTPTVTGTPPTPSDQTPAPTATPTPPLFARACVTPNPIKGGSVPATLYVQSLPGASCSASVTYNNGQSPTDLTASPQITESNGVATFTFTENVNATGGTVNASCTLNGQTQSTSTAFVIIPSATTVPSSQPPGPVPAAQCSSAGGVQATANVQQPFPPRGVNEPVFGCLTVDGNPVARVSMSARFDFASGEQFCSSVTGSNGIASCSENTSSAGPGETVLVDISFIYQGHTYSAQTSFTVL